MASRMLAFAGMLFVFAGCKDKAQHDYESCLTFETQGDYDTARSMCQFAVKADPNSQSGKAAAAKLTELQEKLDAVEAKQQAATAAAVSAQAARDAACHKWTTICTVGRFPDGSEQTSGLLSFTSKADCLGAGASLGNVPCDSCKCRE